MLEFVGEISGAFLRRISLGEVSMKSFELTLGLRNEEGRGDESGSTDGQR